MKKRKQIFTGLITAFFLFIIFLFLKDYFDGKFNSVETLQEYIKQYGIFGPIVLTVIQALQVVIPILPGFLGCAVGTVLYGWFAGFVCNYIGVVIGSIIAFFLARQYGIKIVKSLFSEEKYEKYSTWAGNSQSYIKLLFWAIVLPVFPDDFLCYFSGLISLETKKFITIIIIGKPWCTLVYCLFFAYFI